MSALVSSALADLDRRVRVRWQPSERVFVVVHYRRTRHDGSGWQTAATFSHQWCAVAWALDSPPGQDAVRTEAAHRDARQLSWPCDGQCGPQRPEGVAA